MLEQRLPQHLLHNLVQRMRIQRIRVERLLQPPMELLPRLHVEGHRQKLRLRRVLPHVLSVLIDPIFFLWLGLPTAILVGLLQQALP